MKKIFFRLLTVTVCFIISVQTAFAAQLVVPGGNLIGLELQDHSLTVAAFAQPLGDPAKSSGLQVGDKLIAINGKPVDSVAEVRDALQYTDGEARLTVVRDGKEKQLSLRPSITSDGPRLGIYLKEGITGVGTVTWYDPADGSFGALGHGVSGADGRLIRMDQGTVYHASVLTVKTGAAGAPGQLVSGLTGAEKIGTLSKNTAQGVFGTIRLPVQEEVLHIGEKEDVHTGKATIRSTVSGSQLREYSVEIVKVYPNSGPSGRNMLVQVTDPLLLSATGGIVQGMSGSPIIQDGKLVGAVTHVLVNDPTMGYGIFIENMLDAAA